MVAVATLAALAIPVVLVILREGLAVEVAKILLLVVSAVEELMVVLAAEVILLGLQFGMLVVSMMES